MYSLYLKAKEFLLAYLILVVIFIDILFSFKKDDIHIFINQFHSSFFDRFFLAYTNLGDGYFALCIALLLFFYSVRKALFAAFSFAITGLVVGIIKRMFFYGEPRPLTYFEGIYKLYIVPGLEPNEINSFPSGHSALAFSVFLCLALIVRRSWVKYFFFICATLVCYSRMYLSEHFMLDVFAGSCIGVMVSSFVFVFFKSYGSRIGDESIVSLLQKIFLKGKAKE